MKLPLTDFFKKKKAGAAAPISAAAPIVRIEKPASERLGKTFRPNTSRGSSSSSFSSPASSAIRNPQSAFPETSSSPGSPPPAPVAPTAPKPFSLGGNGPREAFTPHAMERTIALPLSEIIPQLPADLLQTAGVDPERRILLKASELEREMANGHPTVLLRSIYQQAPEIFNSDVSANDPREVPLPFAKVLEQFAGMQVRDDQMGEPAAPEAGERFGTPAPAPKLQPLAPIKLSVPKQPNGAAAGASTSTPIRLDQLPARAAIALKIPPNGTGASTSERVPASGGPPVLTSPPVTPAPKPAPALKLRSQPVDQTESEAPAPSRTEARIRLPLRAVLRSLPPSQLNGPIDEVSATAQIELPFALLEPQLSLGRIAISPEQFQAAMPEEYRRLFKPDDAGTLVSLPLPEVLQNLPGESLQLRADQEETPIAASFDTPFSQKAAEDAARLKVPSGPIAKSAPLAGGDDPGESDVALAKTPRDGARPGSPPPTPTARTALQAALDTDDELDAKSIVAHASRLPGVSACAIVLSDGLSLAGNIPADYAAEALCAMAPAIVRRINEEMIGARLGALHAVTLFCAKAPVSFFAHGNICLAALHSAGEIAGEIRARLDRTAEELSRMYAQPA